MIRLNVLKALQVGNALLSNDGLIEQMPYAAWSHPDFQFRDAVHLDDLRCGKDYLAPKLIVTAPAAAKGSGLMTASALTDATNEAIPIIKRAEMLPRPDNALDLTAQAAKRRLKNDAPEFQLQVVSALFIELEPYEDNLWRFQDATVSSIKIEGSNEEILRGWTRAPIFSMSRAQCSALIVEDRAVIYEKSGVAWTHMGKLEPSVFDDHSAVFVQKTIVMKPATHPALTKCYRVLHIASDDLVIRAMTKEGW